MSRLALYLDSDGALWAPPGGWDALRQDDAAGWDALFAPGVADDESLAATPAASGDAQTTPEADASGAPPVAPARQYVLSPVRAPDTR